MIDSPTIAFTTIEKWRRWLEENHLSSDGIFLKIPKKALGKEAVNYQEILDAALCFGWIDAIWIPLLQWMQWNKSSVTTFLRFLAVGKTTCFSRL